MLDLVRIFNLQQTPVCKYAACVFPQRLHWGQSALPELEEDLIL